MASRGFLDYVSRKGYFPQSDEPLHDTNVIVHAKLIWIVHNMRRNILNPSTATHEDYLLFTDTIQRIITKMRKNRVEPIVILPNHITKDVTVKLCIQNEKEWATKRDNKRHHPLPLRKTVLFQALANYNVEVLQADNHSYITMTRVVNELGIPILTTYTDHFLHVIAPGVKYISRSNFTDLSTAEDNILAVSNWNYQTFIEGENITAEDLTLLSVADEAICKTDYHVHYDFYERLVNLLRSPATEGMTSRQKLDLLIERLELDKLKDYMIEQYNAHTAEQNHRNKVVPSNIQNAGAPTSVGNNLSAKYLRSDSCHLRACGDEEIPRPYQKAMRLGRFQLSLLSTFFTQKIFLPSLQEDTAKTGSVFSFSLPIRQYGYAILLNYSGGSSMEEYAQRDSDYSASTVNVENITDIALDDIPALPREERREILFDALRFSSEDRKTVSKHHQPLLKASVLYWTLRCSPPQEYIDAIYYWTEYNFWRKHRDRNFYVPIIREMTTQERSESQYPFTQLTAILHDILNLNEILLCPLPDFEINFQFSYLLQMAFAIRIDNSDGLEVKASHNWDGFDARSSEDRQVEHDLLLNRSCSTETTAMPDDDNVMTISDKLNFRGSTTGLFSGERDQRRSVADYSDVVDNHPAVQPSKERVPLWRRSMQTFEKTSHTTNARNSQRNDTELADGFELPAEVRRRRERRERQVQHPQRSRWDSEERSRSIPQK